MLIDVHAHFYHAGAPRSDWHERNASRLAAGRKIGVTIHVASILGSSWPWPRDTPRCDSSSRTSVAAATGSTHLPPSALRPTCTWISRGAAWTAACSKRASRPPVWSACFGERTSRWTPGGPSCAIWSACFRRATWSSCNGGTRHASFRAARSPPTDADRRQRLPRRLPLSACARYVARRAATRHDARRDRRSVGEPSAEPVLAAADGGERLAVRHRGA